MGDYTYGSVFWMYSVMALFLVGAVFCLAQAIRSGAVKDDEAPKYRMLEDDLIPGADVLEGEDHGERS